MNLVLHLPIVGAMWNMNLPSLTWNGQQLHCNSRTLSLMEWMLFRWCFGNCSPSISCSFNNVFSPSMQFWNTTIGKEQDRDKDTFPRFDSFKKNSMFSLGLLNWYSVLTFYLYHNLYSNCVLLLPLMSVFVAPYRHKDKDCRIGSKFASFTLLEPCLPY
jgi:hypothetical protein